MLDPWRTSTDLAVGAKHGDTVIHVYGTFIPILSFHDAARFYHGRMF